MWDVPCHMYLSNDPMTKSICGRCSWEKYSEMGHWISPYWMLLRWNLGRERFPFFNDETRDSPNRRLTFIDAFVDFSRLDIKTLSGLVRHRRFSFVVERELAFLNDDHGGAGMGVS